MDASRGSPAWSGAARALGPKRGTPKSAKTELQFVVMRHFYAEFEAATDKGEVAGRVGALTGLTARQVGKWMWDEEVRRRTLTTEERAQLERESASAYHALLDFFEKTLPLSSLYVMRTLYLPAGGDLKASVARARRGFRQLSRETVLLVRKGSSREHSP